MDTPARNLIARANIGVGPIIIVGAHYDTRRRADQDEVQPEAPVPGANDGASGVAVLLELARVLDLATVPNEIWLAFFDAEDNGRLDGWEWIAGSTYMAANLTVEPESMILVDMVGDADQQFYFDNNSDVELNARVWTVAAQLGYGDHFIPLPKYTMTDDHIPFRDRGIPAIDIIDFDYPYWHTTEDTADKVSAESLERVGRTLEAVLEKETE
jgi:Zn-dependent M28 family amino/carboxypeptidase